MAEMNKRWRPVAIIWAAGLVLISVVASAQIPDQRRSLPYDVLINADRFTSPRPAAGVEVLRSAEELSSLLRSFAPWIPVPEVDFKHRMVVAGFLDVCPEGGCTVDFKRVYVRGGQLVVEIVTTEPGPECGGLAMASLPWFMIVTKSWPGPAEIAREVHVRHCNP